MHIIITYHRRGSFAELIETLHYDLSVQLILYPHLLERGGRGEGEGEGVRVRGREGGREGERKGRWEDEREGGSEGEWEGGGRGRENEREKDGKRMKRK